MIVVINKILQQLGNIPARNVYKKKLPDLLYFLCSAILSFSEQRVVGPDATCLVASGTTATSTALHLEVVEPSDGFTVFHFLFDLCVCMSHIDYICVYVYERE